jgi:hypothetical protein
MGLLVKGLLSFLSFGFTYRIFFDCYGISFLLAVLTDLVGNYSRINPRSLLVSKNGTIWGFWDELPILLKFLN